jgi:hypothetical protein
MLNMTYSPLWVIQLKLVLKSVLFVTDVLFLNHMFSFIFVGNTLIVFLLFIIVIIICPLFANLLVIGTFPPIFASFVDFLLILLGIYFFNVLNVPLLYDVFLIHNVFL